MTLQCKSCRRTVAVVLGWHRQHVRASCPECGGTVAMMQQTSEVLALVGPKPVRSETPTMFSEEDQQ